MPTQKNSSHNWIQQTNSCRIVSTGRIAQSVEPLVMGSSPIVTIFKSQFCCTSARYWFHEIVESKRQFWSVSNWKQYSAHTCTSKIYTMKSFGTYPAPKEKVANWNKTNMDSTPHCSRHPKQDMFACMNPEPYLMGLSGLEAECSCSHRN